MLCELAKLPALTLAGGRGTLLRVERVPIAAEIGEVGAARMGLHGEIQEWVALLADMVRHFFKIDEIESQPWLRAQKRQHIAPGLEESLCAHAGGEILCQQRCVVVA